MATGNVVVYEPDRAIKIGFLAQWQEMVVELVKSRELIWRLFLRDLQAKYKQSLLGVAWAIINPLVTIGVFVYLNSAGVLRIGSTGVPYVVFAIVGLTIWNLFATGISAATNSIVGAGPLVTKINFPKVSLVFSSIGQSLVEFGIRLILTAIILFIYKVMPAWSVIFLPLSILPILFLTIGLGFILSLLAGVFRDVVNAISLITTFLMFLTPILYPSPKSGVAAKLLVWNPIAQLVVGPRDLVIFGKLSNPLGFLWSALFALIVFFVFWRLFYLAETKIAERI
ncbi:MAG: ABC transporter permease [Actinomycetota bacterium]|nr:ABC transporter permease [Actinomycetota bacterium]